MYPYKFPHDVDKLLRHHHLTNQTELGSNKGDIEIAKEEFSTGSTLCSDAKNKKPRKVENGKSWEEIVAVLASIAVMFHMSKERRINSKKLLMNKMTREKKGTSKIKHRERRGGMYTEDRDEPREFTTLHTPIKLNSSETDEDEFEFIQRLSPSIGVDEDEEGKILFRRNNHGIQMTKDVLNKCIKMVSQSCSMEEIYSAIDMQALYKFRDNESRATAGQGLCAILALAGSMNPQLNTPESMKSPEGRSTIAEIIEKILIPSITEYEQPMDHHINPRSPEHVIHRDHTINHLVSISTLLRDTLDTYVDQDNWMYATGVGTVIQAMPSEVVYWQEIGDNNWLSLDLWSSTASHMKRQNMQTLQEILKSGTGHVAYARSHFFNIEEIGTTRYKNILIEIVHAINLTQEHKIRNTENVGTKSEQVQSEDLDEGCLATQKMGAQWFMSISKKRARELSRLMPTQIKAELLRSKSTIQINKRTKCVNWSLVNGDNYCGYQALHATAMHAEGRTYNEISCNIQTAVNPYKLISFLQKQVSKLQGSNMQNALKRVTSTIQSLKGPEIINKKSWCPTEMVEHILPSINPNSSYWNHSCPPTGGKNWITTYYNESWLNKGMGLDIVFNGEDHYTILPSNQIRTNELIDGIDRLVSAITNSIIDASGWTTTKGQRVTRMTQIPKITKMEDSEDEEYIEVTSSRNRKKSKIDSHGHNITECIKMDTHDSENEYKLTTPRPKNQRAVKEIHYGPKYHPLYDAIPSPEIMEIPFPKTQRKDPTARKNLVVAPSRIGDGLGVYTLAMIPQNTIIMEFVDEAKEVITKKDIHEGTRDTSYMYANHKTNTYINASNNTHSYCGLVNEALDDKNFNTIICESRDTNGKIKVFYKTTRIINAKEEIGTRYSIDGSYWDPSKQYTEEFLSKVKECYNKVIPYQRLNDEAKESANTIDEQATLMSRYNETVKTRTSSPDEHEENRQRSESFDMYEIGRGHSNERNINNDTPHSRVQIQSKYIGNERWEKDDDRMDISEDDSVGLDEEHIHTEYRNYPNMEANRDSIINCHPTCVMDINKSMEQGEKCDSPEQHRKHKFKGSISKRKRHKGDIVSKQDVPKEVQRGAKHKRGSRRIPRREQNATRRQNDETELSILELQGLEKEALVEYVLNQRCRHKKALDEKAIGGNQVHESAANYKKKRPYDKTSENVTNLNTQLTLNAVTKKIHNLRQRTYINYQDQMDEEKGKRTIRKICFKEPNKPKYILNDVTVTNPDAFMVAGSNLKNGIQGVFAREAIPLKGSRKLFEYTSENNYGTTQLDKVKRYLEFKSDNKFIVNIGNVIVDAAQNVTSYCNHVQELLNHSRPFNCKYVKSGNLINIVQISPIAKNEELNIQYSIDESYWNNRSTGYPEEVLKQARAFYKIAEPKEVKKKEANYEMPNYTSIPSGREHNEDFNLMNKATLFRWTSRCSECNIRIATLNMNGALFDPKNGEPLFIMQLMTQCGLNIIGLTDTRTPVDKAEYVVKSMKYHQTKGTAVICFPTQRSNKNTTRLTTMGGQMIIVDKQWEPWITHKKSDDSKLCLIVSVGLTYQQNSMTIIQVMVPPHSTGEYTMWSRLTKYLSDSGIKKTPRDYVLDTASRWHLSELAKGKKVIIMGDFNRTHYQLNQWQIDNNLHRAHDVISKAQEHPDRTMYTYLRNSTTYSHIDHIYHSSLDPITISSIGASDHEHIHEKTDHFPIWIAMKWPGHMPKTATHKPSTSIKNLPDIDLEDYETITQFAKELDTYIDQFEEISEEMTPEKAGCIQAAIFAKSAQIVKELHKPNFQTSRPTGIHHRYKDGFSPSYRILQESLHAYINLGRVLNRLAKKTHTATVRLKELRKIYPRWKKTYDKYFKSTHQEDHCDAHLLPLELNNITIQQSKGVDIADKIAKIKSRLHGRQRTILRTKLSERCKTMQHNISINKLKKVIQMIIPTERSAFDYAAISLDDGTPITDKLADLEANRVMKKWMETPSSQHYISQEFVDDPKKWKSLLNGTYKPPLSGIPMIALNPAIEAFKIKNIEVHTKVDLHIAMHKNFTFSEFNRARKNVTKNKSPGPSGVTNNQMKSWSDNTAKAIFELSSIMWAHHSVPQFWQDRLMTLLPKVAGENNLSKIRPISLFENIRKLWAGMVSRRVQTIWNRDKLLHPNQHGFRWLRGTHTAVLHLLNELEIADTSNPVYLTMWDIRRAFDSVPKWLQRLAWARLGMDTQDLEWFLKLDATGNVYIRTPEFEANKKQRLPDDHLQGQTAMIEAGSNNKFHPERGVGQGDTPSSLIFIAVFDILLTLLDTSKTGQPHAYADDLAHIAKTPKDQQTHADLVSAFCVITGLEVATTKVEAIALNHYNNELTTTLIIRDWWWTPHLVIQSDKDFWTRYLGIYLDSKQCTKHYEQAVKQYKLSCHALIHRTAPSSAKKMVHTLCLRPKMRYVAALAPWTLKQYKKIDQIPYQLFCQIYGLRRGFPLALVYTPISMGGCGDTKLSDEANSMKWKILHSSIHLGGLSKETSNELIQRALTRRNTGQNSRGYADSLIEWCMEMGLSLHKHIAEKEAYPLLRLNQILKLQDPESDINIYSDGAYDTDKKASLVDKLTMTPTQIRHKYGVGKSGVYIEGTLANGIKNKIAMKLTFQGHTKINTTPFIQELIGILVGVNIAQRSTNRVRAFTDCKSALTKVKDAFTEGSKTGIHLPYGPLLRPITSSNINNYHIEWIESHPEKKKKHMPWDDKDHGIYKADTLASKSTYEIHKELPDTTIIQGDIVSMLKAVIPTGTWIWKTNEGDLVLESLRARSSLSAHESYLNRRDTLRNKGDLTAPSRWNRYNMYMATHLNGSRQKCSTRLRGHQCKQMYDWTTHAVNLAKGVPTKKERDTQAVCKLCTLGVVENQVHTSTTCSNKELQYIRELYKKEITDIFLLFEHAEIPRNTLWIKEVITYVKNHIWQETETTADIWNGRWTRHMWEEALANVNQKVRAGIDITLCRKWLSIITTKLFEAQSALSRHRFKLMKRIKNPMFERAQKMSASLKAHILSQYCKDTRTKNTVKCYKRDVTKHEGVHQTTASKGKKRKRMEKEDTNYKPKKKSPPIAIIHPKNEMIVTPHEKKQSLPIKDQKIITTKPTRARLNHNTKRKTPSVWEHGTINLHKRQRKKRITSPIKKQKIQRKQRDVRRTHKTSYNINPTGRLGHRGEAIHRGWYSYLRRIYFPKYLIRTKHKLCDREELRITKKQK